MVNVLLSIILLGGQVETPLQLLEAVCAEPEEVLGSYFYRHWPLFIGGDYSEKGDYPWTVMVRKSEAKNSLEKLVSLGAAAIPTLVSEIDSKVPTAVSMEGGAFSSMFLDKGYDPARRVPGREEYVPPDSKQWDESDLFEDRFTVCRGDVAFFALGKIVNRHYGSFGGRYINSSTLTTRIQARVKVDWANFTNEKLKASLEYDVLFPDSADRQNKAIARFWTYFPSETAALVLKCLSTDSLVEGVDEIGSDIIYYAQLFPNPEIDKIAYRMLLEDRAEPYPKSKRVKMAILNYLRQRPKYLARAVEYAKKAATSEKTYRYDKPDYEQFVKAFGPK